MDGKCNSNKKQYYNISIVMFLYVFSWSGCIGLLALWLDKVAKLDGGSIGLVFGINAACAIIIQPIYGWVMDRIGLKKSLLYVVILVSVLMYPFFYYIYAPLLINNIYVAIFVGGIYIGMGWAAGIAAFESYCDRFSSYINIEFGRIRMWGSLGWAAGASFSGLLFNISPFYNFIVGSIISLCIFPLLLLLKTTANEKIDKDTPSKQEKITKNDVIKLLKSREFFYFCFYVTGVVCIMAVAEQQFSRYFVSFFSNKEVGNSVYGYLSTLQCIIEFTIFLFAPPIVNKIGARRGLLIVGFIVAARMFFTGITDSYIIISILKPIYGIEISLLLISTFKYISDVFSESVKSTVYLLGYQAISQVSIALASSPVGFFYERIGFGQTYIYLSLLVFIFTVVSYFKLSNEIVFGTIESEAKNA